VKCTGKRLFRKRRNRKKELAIRLTCGILAIATVVTVCCILFTRPQSYVEPYEQATYCSSIYQADMFADDLCVTASDIEYDAFYRNDKFPGALLFDLENQKVLYSEKANDQLYPASTTKILTAYLALKYGNLEDYVTVSKTAVDVPSDSSKANLKAGDVLTLEDLLYGLMLPSGNDSAVAIAEHISGTTEDFVALMNKEAALLGATNTHFTNPHGYQDKDHYTTAYDLYLIFNECIQNEEFVKIISSLSWTTNITQSDDSVRKETWKQSNQFIDGARKVPKGVTVIGGKTGTTFNAGACILLYVKDSQDVPYIAIIMGASSRRNLYDNMTFLLDAIE